MNDRQIDIQQPIGGIFKNSLVKQFKLDTPPVNEISSLLKFDSSLSTSISIDEPEIHCLNHQREDLPIAFNKLNEAIQCSDDSNEPSPIIQKIIEFSNSSLFKNARQQRTTALQPIKSMGH